MPPLTVATGPVRCPAGGAPLFLVHDGTGSAEPVPSLARYLSGSTPVFALPALDGPGPRLRTVEGIALRLVRRILEVQPRGPYRIAGWSLGGIVAYEAAGLLLGRDERVEFLGSIHVPARPPEAAPADAFDARDELVLQLGAIPGSAGDARSTEFAAAAHAPDFETLVARCRGTALLPDPATPAEVRGWLETRWMARRAVRRYVPPPLPVPVHLFTADEADGAGPWRTWGAAEPKAEIRRVPVPAGASPPGMPEGGALAEALVRELRRAGEPKAAGPEEPHSPVFPLRFRGSGAPVYCVPGAGASVVGLADLAACLDPGWPVYGLEPRGMDGASVPHATVHAAADHYLARIADHGGAGPIHLVGHSFGGWVAFEMALRLLAAGRPVASLSLIDSSVPRSGDSAVREYDAEEAFLSFLGVVELAAERTLEIDPEEIRALDQDSRLRLLHGRMVRFGIVPSRSGPAMLAGPFRVFSACLRAAYRPSAPYPRAARLVLLRDPRLGLEADQLRMSEVARGWKGWAPGVQVSVGPGNHMTALKRPHVERLASLLPLDA